MLHDVRVSIVGLHMAISSSMWSAGVRFVARGTSRERRTDGAALVALDARRNLLDQRGRV
jgi:hypothetical protein